MDGYNKEISKICGGLAKLSINQPLEEILATYLNKERFDYIKNNAILNTANTQSRSQSAVTNLTKSRDPSTRPKSESRKSVSFQGEEDLSPGALDGGLLLDKMTQEQEQEAGGVLSAAPPNAELPTNFQEQYQYVEGLQAMSARSDNDRKIRDLQFSSRDTMPYPSRATSLHITRGVEPTTRVTSPVNNQLAFKVAQRSGSVVKEYGNNAYSILK